MYGFRKVVTTEAVNVKVGKDDLEFAHPHFIRCHEELLELTKRKNTAELKNRTSDVTDETINVESIDAQTSQETELFADILVILKSVIGFLHESNFLTNKSLIQQELMKWLPTVADFELECYITCIWFTAHCLTSKATTSLPDVTTITQTVQRVSGFCTPIIVEPSLECHSNAPAVVETSASTTYSAVASCTETDADGFLPTNSKTAQPAIDGVEQSDAVVPTGCDCVEIMTRVKTERNDECEIIASSSSVCGVNPDIILNTGDLPVAVTSTEAVTSAAAAGKTVESGRSEFECNRIKYELKDCYVLLERLDQHPPGNARADVENIIPDMPTTEAVSVQSLVHELIDQSHVTPFHDERTVLTRDYSTEGLREESRNLTAVQTLLPTELSSSYAPREKPYKCSFCVSSFFRPYDLSRHELIHTGEKKHKCNVCGASFFRGDHLREHERIHTGEKPFKCQVCGSSFARSSDQRKHESKHAYKRTFNLTEKKPVRCSICGASFPGFSSLRFHRRTVHGGDVMPFKCQLCGASFSSVDGLRSHETKHTNFTCKICGDSFRLFSELRSHIKTSHAGEKVTCKTCGLVCAKPATLRTHQLTHTGEKHFKCNTCGVSFAQRGSLSRHELTHTGEKPHKCKTCGAGFTQSGHLRAHEFLHTGIKPHVCSTCNQAFAHRRHLVRHVRRRHEKMSLKSSPVVVWHAVNTTEVTESGSHLLPSGEVVQPKVEATYAVSQETAVKTIVF